MENIKKTLKNHYFAVGLTVLLVIHVVLIVYCNFTLMDQNLDCDNGKLFTHIMHMWTEKTFLLKDWYYSTTLEWDCSALFAVFFYGLTGNIYVACSLSNAILLLIFLAAVFYLFRGKNILYPLLCANLLCIPYRIGMLDYFNMLFFAGTQYIVKITIPLLLIGILLSLEQEDKSKRDKAVDGIYIALYFFYLFVSSSSSGIYVTACGLMPVVLAYVARKFFRWEKASVKSCLILVLTFVCALIGMMINRKIMGGTRSDSMVLASIWQMHNNVVGCFNGIFELMGALLKEEGILVFSLHGISVLLKVCLTIAAIGCGILSIVFLVKKDDLRRLLLVSVPVWNYFILNVAYVRAGSETYEYRYHLIGMIPLMCVMVYTVLEFFFRCRKEQQWVLYALGVCVVLAVSGSSFKEMLTRGEQNADLKELCAYFENTDVEVVYLFDASNDSDMAKVIDQSRPYICCFEDGRTYAYDYYLSYKDAPMRMDGDVIVAVAEDTYDFGDSFEIAGHRLVKYDSVGYRSLYYFAD